MEQVNRGRIAPLTQETLDAIRTFDTCTIANAIERFQVRLRNEGFTKPGLRCLTEGLPKMLGYAATCRERSADPPMTGGVYVDRSDWWAKLNLLPVPRIAVIESLDASPCGSTVGEVHAAVFKALRCEGLVTNGAVRDIPGISRLPFPVLASSVAVSHSYAHILDFGQPVEIYGLKVCPGDLLFADSHGVVSIPLEIAPKLPAVAEAIRAKDREIVELCLSNEFTLEKLRVAVRG